jgi:hypothetical protein
MRPGYNVLNNNCQVFVYGMLKSMGIIGKRAVKYSQDPAAKPLPKKLLYYRHPPPVFVPSTEKVDRDEIVPVSADMGGERVPIVGGELVPIVGSELVPDLFVPSSARMGDEIVPLYEKVDSGFVRFSQAGNSVDDVASRAIEVSIPKHAGRPI